MALNSKVMPDNRLLRVSLTLTVLGALVWLLAGLRLVPATDEALTVRIWRGGTPSALAPGWAVAPPGLAHLVSYPAHPAPVRVRLGAEGTLHSKEGAGVIAAGSLRLEPDPGRAEDLARALPSGWREPAAGVEALIGPALARVAGVTPLADLISPERNGADTVLPGEVVEALTAAGLIPRDSSTLSFYPASPPGEAIAGRRILLVGLDGADWEIIDPLIDAGRMPNLARLVREGARARLKTIPPALSPIVWTTIATGVGPERHGIVDFLATSATTGEQIPVTSNMRQVKALWNILSERGLTSGIIAWWATWPAEAVRGFLVSDRVAYQLFGFHAGAEGLRHLAYPEALALTIRPRIVRPASISEEEVARFIDPGSRAAPGYDDLVMRLKTTLASSRTYLDLGMDLLSAYDPDLKAIYFEGTDTVAHNFMRYRPPALPGVGPAQLAAYGGVVDRYYEYQDAVLGRILELADERTIVIVCSDHGFRNGSNRPASDPRIETGGAADWHRKFGILIVAGPGVRRGASLEDISVIDVAPTVLWLMGLPVGEDMPGRVLSEVMMRPHPIETVPTWETGARARGPDGAIDSTVDEEILAKLAALGYLGMDGPNALNNTGINLMERGRLAEAADSFGRALEQEPEFTAARLNLGRIQMLMKDFDAALATFDAVARADPASSDVHNLIGNVHMDRGDLKRAEAAFQRAFAINPRDTHARNSLGLLYQAQGRTAEALAQFMQVVKQDPDYAEAFNNIGLIHRMRGATGEAIDWFRRAVEADGDFAGSYNNMGLAYQDAGRLAEARRAFVQGLAIEPSNAVMLNNLGALDLAEGDLPGARGRFEQAIGADPEYASAYNNLGAVIGMLGDEKGAAEQYLKALSLDPGYADARFNLARHLLLDGRSAEARVELEAILSREAGYGQASLQMGLLLAREGDLPGALARAIDAAQAMPKSVEPHNLLADIYVAQGRLTEARAAVEASLAINPSQPRVRELLSRLTSGPSR